MDQSICCVYIRLIIGLYMSFHNMYRGLDCDNMYREQLIQNKITM